MKIPTKTLCIGCTAAFLSGGTAWAQEACTTYVVVPGDNLRYIARSAYGDADMYRVIYSANVDTIGAKADLIEIGASLVIPCDPREETVTAAAPSVGLQTEVVDPAKQPVEVVPELPVGNSDTVQLELAPQPAAEPAPEPVPETIEVAAAAPEPTAPATQPPMAFPYRLVTGNGYAPFADEMLPGGGMFTQLVEMAIFRADPAIPYNLTFVNDWQAHIDALLPSGAYDLSFPWVRPDCEAPDALSAGDLARCENFEFSAPLYEVVDGFFMPADSELLSATSYTAFEGKRICRPEGYTTGVLEAAGLTSDNVELSRPIEVTDCFEDLASGKVDLVSIDAEVGDSAIAQLGMIGEFAQNPHLMTLDSLHVIAHKSNARAVEMIRQMDGGVIEMYESGEWYDIVSSALARGALQQ
jgi:polar amino acid transport system substrate-binding protein